MSHMCQAVCLLLLGMQKWRDKCFYPQEVYSIEIMSDMLMNIYISTIIKICTKSRNSTEERGNSSIGKCLGKEGLIEEMIPDRVFNDE